MERRTGSPSHATVNCPQQQEATSAITDSFFGINQIVAKKNAARCIGRLSIAELRVLALLRRFLYAKFGADFVEKLSR
jgi:hypothetical protein